MTTFRRIVWLLLGVVVGLSGPLGVVDVGGFGIVAGPTVQGLVFLLALLTMVVSGIATGRAGGRSIAATTFVLSGLLSVGTIVGAVARPILGISPVAERPAPSQPVAQGTPYVPRVILRAHADVTVHLDEGPALTPGAAPLDDGGRFGHWCVSRGDSQALGSIEAHDVGQLGETVVRVSVLFEVGPAIASFTPTPWVVFHAAKSDGTVPASWSGQGRTISEEPSAGRVEFDGLVLELQSTVDSSATAWPTALSGAVTWTCQDWTASS